MIRGNRKYITPEGNWVGVTVMTYSVGRYRHKCRLLFISVTNPPEPPSRAEDPDDLVHLSFGFVLAITIEVEQHIYSHLLK
jgi:hypothetical protein